MLKNVTLKPITGTFVNMLISDTGICNAGKKEWEQDFRMLKAMGMDSLFVIRTYSASCVPGNANTPSRGQQRNNTMLIPACQAVFSDFSGYSGNSQPGELSYAGTYAVNESGKQSRSVICRQHSSGFLYSFSIVLHPGYCSRYILYR